MTIAILALHKADYINLKSKLNVKNPIIDMIYIHEEKQVWGMEFDAVFETALAKHAPGYSKLKKEVSIRMR